MVTAELINNIKGQISSGQTSDTIRASLISQGWSEQDIAEAFTQATENQSYPNTSADAVPIPPQPEKPAGIFDFKKMKWYEWLALLPAFFLIIQGGAVGALIGILGWMLSLKVIRNKNLSTIVKILAVVGIVVVYYVIFIISAAFIVGFIHGLTGK